MAELTFPAAPLPPVVLRLRRVGFGVAAVVAVWTAVGVQGTGVGGLLLVIGVLCAVPTAWVLAMTPHAYSLDGEVVRVHRRWLPDSELVMRGSPERLSAAQARSPQEDRGIASIGGRSYRVSRAPVLSAMTDPRKGVRVTLWRGRALLISPDDPDAFVHAAEGGRWA